MNLVGARQDPLGEVDCDEGYPGVPMIQRSPDQTNAASADDGDEGNAACRLHHLGVIVNIYSQAHRLSSREKVPGRKKGWKHEGHGSLQFR